MKDFCKQTWNEAGCWKVKAGYFVKSCHKERDKSVHHHYLWNVTFCDSCIDTFIHHMTSCFVLFPEVFFESKARVVLQLLVCILPPSWLLNAVKLDFREEAFVLFVHVAVKYDLSAASDPSGSQHPVISRVVDLGQCDSCDMSVSL